jgi:hypothetical protein
MRAAVGDFDCLLDRLVNPLKSPYYLCQADGSLVRFQSAARSPFPRHNPAV